MTEVRTVGDVCATARILRSAGVARRETVRALLIDAGPAGIHGTTFEAAGFSRSEVHQHLQSLGHDGYDWTSGGDLVTLTKSEEA